MVDKYYDSGNKTHTSKTNDERELVLPTFSRCASLGARQNQVRLYTRLYGKEQNMYQPKHEIPYLTPHSNALALTSRILQHYKVKDQPFRISSPKRCDA